MKKYIVDRIEGEYAVCENEDKTFENISLREFNFEIKSGYVILYRNGVYSLDLDSTDKLRKANFELQNSLFE